MNFIVHTNKGKMQIKASTPDEARKKASADAPGCIIHKVKIDRSVK